MILGLNFRLSGTCMCRCVCVRACRGSGMKTNSEEGTGGAFTTAQPASQALQV